MGKFVKDSLITFIARILSLALSLGASVILARTLGPEGRGIQSLASLLPALLLVFTNFGIYSASAFYAGKAKYSPREILGTNVVISFFISIFAILIGLIIIFFFSDNLFHGVPKIYLFLVLPLIPCQLFLNSINSIFWGLQRIKEYNIVSILQSFVYLVFIVIFLWGLGFGIKAAIIVEIVSYFFAGGALIFLIKRIMGYFVPHLNKFYVKEAFLYGMKMYFGGILTFLHSRLDVFIINFFLNPVAVGFYFIARNLAEKILLIPQSASFVLFPKVSSEKDDKTIREFTPIVCRNSLFITILGVVVLSLVGHWLIIFFYSKEFLSSVWPFRVLLIGSMAMAGAGALCSDVAARGKPMLNNYVAIICIILNITLNIFLIPKFGILGAAWATVASSVIGFVMILIIYNKVSGNKIKDVILLKKSDFILYKNFIKHFWNKIFLIKKYEK